ncbi:MAG: M23 family metallopeptidase [bacterium]|nr:M23 family metallopeptidase [bacterium]
MFRRSIAIAIFLCLVGVIASYVIPLAVSAHAGASIEVAPPQVMQGEAALATIEGVDIRDIKKFTFGGKAVPLFVYKGEPTAFLGADLSLRPQTYKLVAHLFDGEKVEQSFTVLPRPKHTAPLGIPQKLGGNTSAAQRNLVSEMTKENLALSRLVSSRSVYWKEPFILPLAQNVISDVFGYSRKTGTYNIPHRGVDFTAASGTPVFAINEGRVALAREFIVYGKMVAIDHGAGVVSLYLHFSDMLVKEGEKVKRGQQIGFSGDSGYALLPHLHLSIRVNGYSVDPMKFLELIR